MCKQMTIDSNPANPIIFHINSAAQPIYRYRGSTNAAAYTQLGYRCRGYNEWNNIYRKYCVIGATCKVEVLERESYVNDSTPLPYNEIMMHKEDHGNTVSTELEDYRELGVKGKVRYLTMDTNNRQVKGNRSITMKFGVYKDLGIDRKKTQLFHVDKQDVTGLAANLDDEQTEIDDQVDSTTGGSNEPINDKVAYATVDGSPSHSQFIHLRTSENRSTNYKVRVTIRQTVVFFDKFGSNESTVANDEN